MTDRLDRPAIHPLRRLHARLALHVALASTLLALVAGFAVYRWSYVHSLSDSETVLRALADAVERTAAVGAYANDPVLMQEVADGLAKNRLVAAVQLHAGPQTIAGRRPGSAATLTPVSSSAATVRVWLTSPFDPAERVGELRLEPDLAMISTSANQQATAVVALLVTLIAVIALIVHVVAQRLIARPISNLADELGHLPPGTDARLALPGGHAGDEIGTLVDSTNQLLQSNHAALARERALRTAIEAIEAQYRSIFNASSAGIFVLDGRRRLINANPTAFRIIRWAETAAPEDARSESFVERVFLHPERVHALIDRSTRMAQTVSGDFELRNPSGGPRWVHCLFSQQDRQGEPPAGEPFVEGVLYDVTERRRAEHAARHEAAHDALTGLLNRAACAAAVAGWRPARTELAEEPYTALFIDLDGFKAVNDSHGHAAGDKVLRETAQRLLASVRRSTDIVARNGGDEFVVVLRGLGAADAPTTKITEQIRSELTRPVTLGDGRQADIGVSIGMASYPLHGASLQAVLLKADAAMYEVKRTGKNCFAMACRTEPPP